MRETWYNGCEKLRNQKTEVVISSPNGHDDTLVCKLIIVTVK